MTPRSFRCFAEGRGDAIKDRHESTKANIYSLACLIRSAVWAKHMPQYDRIFRTEKKRMTDEEMFQNVLALNRMLGGAVEEGEQKWQS